MSAPTAVKISKSQRRIIHWEGDDSFIIWKKEKIQVRSALSILKSDTASGHFNNWELILFDGITYGLLFRLVEDCNSYVVSEWCFSFPSTDD